MSCKNNRSFQLSKFPCADHGEGTAKPDWMAALRLKNGPSETGTNHAAACRGLRLALTADRMKVLTYTIALDPNGTGLFPGMARMLYASWNLSGNAGDFCIVTDAHGIHTEQ